MPAGIGRIGINKVSPRGESQSFPEIRALKSPTTNRRVRVHSATWFVIFVMYARANLSGLRQNGTFNFPLRLNRMTAI